MTQAVPCWVHKEPLEPSALVVVHGNAHPSLMQKLRVKSPAESAQLVPLWQAKVWAFVQVLAVIPSQNVVVV